jgi:thiol-disulfide isomerase/thioredoxin
MTDPVFDFEDLAAMTNPAEVEALQEPLRQLEGDTDLLLFVAPGCTACPHQIRSVATLAVASEKVGVEVVNTVHEPELAAQYQVRSVPTTVVDDELIMVGVIPPSELALRILARKSPQGDKLLFGSLVQAGRFSDAAARIWDSEDEEGLEAFAELWEKSTQESRVPLFLVIEEALTVDPRCLDPLVPDLIAHLEGTDDAQGRTMDASRRADTADLLGRIGHPDAATVLKSLLNDPDSEVVEAAEEALEEMEEA